MAMNEDANSSINNIMEQFNYPLTKVNQQRVILMESPVAAESHNTNNS